MKNATIKKLMEIRFSCQRLQALLLTSVIFSPMYLRSWRMTSCCYLSPISVPIYSYSDYSADFLRTSWMILVSSISIFLICVIQNIELATWLMICLTYKEGVYNSPEDSENGTSDDEHMGNCGFEEGGSSHCSLFI